MFCADKSYLLDINLYERRTTSLYLFPSLQLPSSLCFATPTRRSRLWSAYADKYATALGFPLSMPPTNAGRKPRIASLSGLLGCLKRRRGQSGGRASRGLARVGLSAAPATWTEVASRWGGVKVDKDSAVGPVRGDVGARGSGWSAVGRGPCLGCGLEALGWPLFRPSLFPGRRPLKERLKRPCPRLLRQNL